MEFFQVKKIPFVFSLNSNIVNNAKIMEKLHKIQNYKLVVLAANVKHPKQFFI